MSNFFNKFVKIKNNIFIKRDQSGFDMNSSIIPDTLFIYQYFK